MSRDYKKFIDEHGDYFCVLPFTEICNRYWTLEGTEHSACIRVAKHLHNAVNSFMKIQKIYHFQTVKYAYQWFLKSQ